METEAQPGFRLFENAHAYSQAAKLLNGKTAVGCNSRYMHLSQSAAVYAGLAIDYYLKTLYYLQNKKEYCEQGKTPHDFSTMYGELKHRIRKDLEERFTVRIRKEAGGESPLPRDLKTALKHWTDAFSHLQIQPGRFTGKYLFFFHEMEDVFKSRIFKDQPEWKNRSGHD